MKKLLVIFAIPLILSCTSNVEKVSDSRAFHVYTSEDNGWNWSGVYSCDSIKFKSKNEANIWIDGQSMTIYSSLIRTFQNK